MASINLGELQPIYVFEDKVDCCFNVFQWDNGKRCQEPFSRIPEQRFLTPLFVRERWPRHSSDSAISWSQEHSTHGSLHRAGLNAIPRLLERLSGRFYIRTWFGRANPPFHCLAYNSVPLVVRPRYSSENRTHLNRMRENPEHSVDI